MGGKGEGLAFLLWMNRGKGGEGCLCEGGEKGKGGKNKNVRSQSIGF